MTSELTYLHRVLKNMTEVDLLAIEHIMASSPDWLIKKTAFVPGANIVSKIVCLKYQVIEYMEGRAVDIEDHYLNLGVSQADLTYKEKDKYVFVDVTTSNDKELINAKKLALTVAVSKLSTKCSVDVKSITMDMGLSSDPFQTVDIDVLDKFYKMALSMSPSMKDLFQRAVTGKFYSQIKEELNAASMAHDESDDELSAGRLIAYDLTKHEATMAEFDPELAKYINEISSNIKGFDNRSGLKVPLPGPEITDGIRVDDKDPITTVLKHIFEHGADMNEGVLFTGKIDEPFETWIRTSLTETQKSHLLKYRGKGLTGMQIEVSKSKEEIISFLVSDERIMYKDRSIPKFFTAASNVKNASYGSEFLTRFNMDEDKHYKPFEPSTTYSDALAAHAQDHIIMSTQCDSITSMNFLKKILKVSKESGADVWFKQWVQAGGKSDPFLKTKMFSYLVNLYNIARALGVILSEKQVKYRFRIGFTSDRCTLMAVSIGSQANLFTNVAVSLVTMEERCATLSRCKNRTITISRRDANWWLRLVDTVLLRYTSDGQMNLTKKGKVTTGDIVEFALTHLSTRQADSLMKDQLRYTLAGLYSPIADKVGSMSKLYPEVIRGCSNVVYLLRLIKIQGVSFFSKTSRAVRLQFARDDPIVLVPPFYVNPISNYAQFVDAMFDSTFFNKEKDVKAASEGVDWEGLMQADLKFKSMSEENKLLSQGLMKESLALVTMCVKANSIMPMIEDLSDDNGVMIREAILFISNSQRGGYADYTWSFPVSLAIFMKQTKGRTLVETENDFTSPVSLLGRQSMSKIMSGTGSMEKGEITKDRQAIRKSTALSELMVTEASGDIPTHLVGRLFYNEARDFPGRHQSLLLYSISIINRKGKEVLCSRTDDKDQKGGGREFSPMNAIGVTSTRAAERLVSDVLQMYPVDLMNEKHADRKLYDTMRSMSDKNRTVFVAADCSRFGPNQVMSKSRCVAFALSFKPASEWFRSRMVYEILAEATRLMENKEAKIPYNLYEMLIKMGSLEEIAAKDPSSVYGRIAKMYINQGITTLPIKMEQKWGMYQGALGMFSSIASSMLHETILEIIDSREVCETTHAKVTNDDSGLFFTEVTQDLPSFAKDVVSLTKLVLTTGGQILNTFKTIVSTIFGEFHSRFSLVSGLICPENKTLFSALQLASGESIVKDSRQPIEQALSALREGVSLYSAHALATLLTVKFADQYNRWPTYNKIGSQISALGGPLPINLLGEFMIPSYSDMAILTSQSNTIDTVSRYMVRSMIMEEEDGMISLREAGLKMTTRSVHKTARGLKETGWVREEMWMPIANACNYGALHSLLSSGLLSHTVEPQLEDGIVRFSRNQVSAKLENLYASDNSIAKVVLKKEKLSYTDLVFSKEQLKTAVETIANSLEKTELNDVMIAGMHNLVSSARIVSKYLPMMNSLILEKMTGIKYSTVHPTYVVPKVRRAKELDLETIVTNYASEGLKTLYTKEKNGDFSSGQEFKKYEVEFRSAKAMASVSNKLIHHRKGNMMIIADKGRKISVEDAIVALSKHTIRGAVSKVAFEREIRETAQVTFLPAGFYSAGNTHADKARVVMTAMPFDIDLSFYSKPLVAVNMIPFIETGWWRRGKKKIKAHFIVREDTVTGFRQHARFLMVTYAEEGKLFKHHLFVPGRKINLAEFINVPDYLVNIFKKSKEVSPGALVKLSDQDLLEIVSHEVPVPIKVKAYSSGVTWMSIDSITIPIRFDLRSATNTELYKVKPADKAPSQADLMVFLSLGCMSESNSIIRANTNTPVAATEINAGLMSKGFRSIESCSAEATVIAPAIASQDDRTRFIASMNRLMSASTEEVLYPDAELWDDFYAELLSKGDVIEYENTAGFNDDEVDEEYADIRSADSDEFSIDVDQVESDLAEAIAAALLDDDE